LLYGLPYIPHVSSVQVGRFVSTRSRLAFSGVDCHTICLDYIDSYTKEFRA